MTKVRIAVAATFGLALAGCANDATETHRPEGAAPASNVTFVPKVALAELITGGKPTQARPALRSPDGPRTRAALRARSPLRRKGAKGTGTTEAPAVLHSGPTVAAPKVVPVIFPGNALDAQIRDFFVKLQGSTYWHAATQEYGVGALTTLPVYVPTGPIPDAYTVDQWIADLAGSGAPGLPPPDANTIYAIVLPVGWGAEVGACVQFGAYHGPSYTASGEMVNHTVNPTCAVPYLGLSGIDQVTFGLSHELEESATDPDGVTGYTGVNWAASGWGAAAEGYPGAETADMCEFQPAVKYFDPQIGYMVQRSWSNASAAGGHDPCLPTLPSDPVYFIAEPVLFEGTQVSAGVYARGVSIAPGHEVTIPVVLRADGPAGEWNLAAAEVANPHLSPDIYNELSFSWDRAEGRAGDTRYLTIKRSPPPDGGSPVFLRVAINSTRGSITHTSWLVVGTE